MIRPTKALKSTSMGPSSGWAISQAWAEVYPRQSGRRKKG